MIKPSWLNRISLSQRLMVLSFVFTYIILITLWSVLFLLTKRSLAEQDREAIKNRIGTISSLLNRSSGPSDELSNRIKVEWFYRDFDRIYARVFDPNAALVVETPPDEIHVERLFGKSETLYSDRIQRISIGNDVFQAMRDQVEIRGGATPGKYTIEVAVNRTNEEILIDDFRRFFFILLIVGGGASLWLGRIMVSVALRPVREITAMAARINSDRLGERIDPDSVALEFREVAVTMNDMLNRLNTSFERLTRFSQDMAHELRTPVYNMLGSMQVALSRDRSFDEYKNVLGSGVEECERLKRIIDSLMFIARTSEPNHQIEKQRLSADVELAALVSFYRFSAEEKNIHLSLEGTLGRVIFAERTLLQRCIGNLLSNAIRHSPANSKIILKVEEDSTWITVQVIDFGCGMPETALSRIGERFFRVDESRSKINGGAGLGLSIVKSIVEMHGGKMDIKSDENLGTTVTLHFPK